MTDQATTRAGLEQERAHLVHQIDELTAGGEIDLDFDDNFADSGQVAAEQGENKVLAESLQDQLNDVERALAKIDDGTYGTCATCGKAISDARLEAMPAAQHCIDHA
jgi:RNA polymerase-binding transcription factor DksA